MLGKKVFIVDDEYDILEFLRFNLKKDGFEVFTYDNPLNALPHIKEKHPDIVVTDWLMPGMDGLEFCKYIKRNDETAQIPVIMITCKGEEIDIVTALEIGADDYLVKPFGIKELSVRIKKILLKNLNNNQSPESMMEMNYSERKMNTGLFINKDSYTASVCSKKLNLTYAEYKLLELLAEKPGKVYTRTQIIEHDYGNDYYVTERSVDVKIVGLRKKMGEYGKMIQTIRSVGYRLNEPF
jgi:two-component system phosphate regulon response regulator PhoB